MPKEKEITLVAIEGGPTDPRVTKSLQCLDRFGLSPKIAETIGTSGNGHDGSNGEQHIRLVEVPRQSLVSRVLNATGIRRSL